MSEETDRESGTIVGLLDDNQRESLRRYQTYRKKQENLPEHPVIAYGGTAGAYSEDAVINLFGENSIRLSCREFEDVFRNVVSGSADCGVLPVENSTTGAVRDVSELILQYGCRIAGETEVQVRHCLMGCESATIDSIRSVRSHQQSLYQSEEFLKHHPAWEKTPMANNAFAARMVRDLNDPGVAAIASARCAKIYGLKILEYDINTSGHNATRFLLVARNAPFADEKIARKVSLSFGVPHVPGALYRVLGIFEKHRLNLCRIESRPSGKSNWEYFFFTDFSGVFSDETLDETVRELVEKTIDFRFLGCYPDRIDAAAHPDGD